MTTDRALYSFKVPEPAGVLIINGTNNKPMVTIQRDGSIEFGPTYTPDEAARIFWQCIATWPSGHAAQLAAKDAKLTEWQAMWAQSMLDWDEQRQRADANEADARRYLWLRSRVPGSAYRIAGIFYSEGGEYVDQQIDALAGVGSESTKELK